MDLVCMDWTPDWTLHSMIILICGLATPIVSVNNHHNIDTDLVTNLHKSATDTNHGVTTKARTQECGMELRREIMYRKLENNKQASKSVIRKYCHMMYIWARVSLGLTTF